MIENNINGLYQLTNGIPISKNEILQLLKNMQKKTSRLHQSWEINIDKSFIDTRKIINYKIPSYEEMISEMMDF